LTAVVGHACLLDVVPGERSELAIMVHQDWQNQGIGSALLELTIELARRASYRSIWLTVSIRNKRALHVYRKCGFRICERIDIDIEMERLL
jgi:ribosomal protein S18 acetylase RimI-like enzyme